MHYVGKLNFNALVNVRMADVNYGSETKKCLVIPIEDNDIKPYGNEWQLWFRAFAYRTQTGSFSHFLMKFIPRAAIKKMSQSQIEQFSQRRLGGLMKSSFDTEADIVDEPTSEISEQKETKVDTNEDFIKQNL